MTKPDTVTLRDMAEVVIMAKAWFDGMKNERLLTVDNFPNRYPHCLLHLIDRAFPFAHDLICSKLDERIIAYLQSDIEDSVSEGFGEDPEARTLLAAMTEGEK